MNIRILLILIFLAGAQNLHARSDTTRIYFAFARLDLATEETKIFSDIAPKFAYDQGAYIYGYSDRPGSDSFNQYTADARAQYVAEQLKQRGIPAEKILGIKGIAFANDPARRREFQNNRVEIVFQYVEPKKPVVVVPPPKPQPKSVVQEVAVGATFELKNIQFEGGSHRFLPGAMPDLDALAKALMDNPNMTIKLEGHVCCRIGMLTDGWDKDSNTFDLSFQRARAVADYLVSRGVSESRLSVEGFACMQPKINPERNAADQQANRRVEIRILSK